VWDDVDGSQLRIGLKNVSASLYLAGRGSLLNSAFFRYASPMDRETCQTKFMLTLYHSNKLNGPKLWSCAVAAITLHK